MPLSGRHLQHQPSVTQRTQLLTSCSPELLPFILPVAPPLSPSPSFLGSPTQPLHWPSHSLPEQSSDLCPAQTLSMAPQCPPKTAQAPLLGIHGPSPSELHLPLWSGPSSLSIPSLTAGLCNHHLPCWAPLQAVAQTSPGMFLLGSTWKSAQPPRPCSKPSCRLLHEDFPDSQWAVPTPSSECQQLFRLPPRQILPSRYFSYLGSGVDCITMPGSLPNPPHHVTAVLPWGVGEYLPAL